MDVLHHTTRGITPHQSHYIMHKFLSEITTQLNSYRFDEGERMNKMFLIEVVFLALKSQLTKFS